MGLDKSACANQSQKLLDGQTGRNRITSRLATNRESSLNKPEPAGPQRTPFGSSKTSVADMNNGIPAIARPA